MHVRSYESEDLTWDPSRVNRLKSFVDRAAALGVSLERSIGRPPLIPGIAQQCFDSDIEPQKARAYVFVDLFQKSVDQSNGIAVLIELSLGRQAFQLWRTLFESRVILKYFERHLNQCELACRYIVHNTIRATVRRWEDFNALCDRQGIRGKDHRYPRERIKATKEAYQQFLGEPWKSSNYV